MAVEAAPGPEVQAYAARLGDLPSAAGSTTAQAAGRDTSLVSVFPSGGELDERPRTWFATVRAEPAPARGLAGGQTAEFVDLKASIVDHLPRGGR